jgi:uncharacterized protein YdhG (YjbR/CyaY superfamily)
MKTAASIDAYIEGFPPDVQLRLRRIRAAVRAHAPKAVERIAYGMPTFKQGRNVFHFAAFAHHIGLYPGAAAVAEFAPELGDYKTSKGTIQVAGDQPIPRALIGRLVRFNLRRHDAGRNPGAPE